MKRNEIQWYRGFKLSALLMTGFTALLVGVSPKQAEAVNLGGSTHIGTFEGQTTFQTSSSNGINPGLYLEVMDRYGNYTEYISEDGVITVNGTKEGAYVTQAKFLGKTKYVDQETGEVLDQWEEGRDLKLESVKMPVLTTTGKNLFSNEFELYNNNANKLTKYKNGFIATDYIESKQAPYQIYQVKSNTQYTFSLSMPSGNGYLRISDYYSDSTLRIFYGGNNNEKSYKTTFTTISDKIKIELFGHKASVGNNVELIDIQLEENSTTTSYEPYKTNILTVNEDVELRGIGEVKDELNLLTGELTQRIGEINSKDLSVNGIVKGTYANVISIDHSDVLFDGWNVGHIYSDKLAEINRGDTNWDNEASIGGIVVNPGGFWIVVDKTIETKAQADVFLQNLEADIQYKLATESIKPVDLTSTYTFGTVAMRDVYVDGKVKPLLCSVNVPTENLTFVLDPNQEEEKQFIAPTFRLINETPTSVRVSLTAFKQESNVFNDVSPTKYENWSQLNKEQSKDIALALVPLASDNWVTVDETPRYVNNYSASVLGEIKAKSSVDLTFKALHGQAFTEELNPQYRLVFLFDF